MLFSPQGSFECIKNTINAILNMGVIPIINENDALHPASTFGDNDQLAALTAIMLDADFLFLCTDVDMVYTANPKENPDAQPVRWVADIRDLQVRVE